jgi:hypothetical protein
MRTNAVQTLCDVLARTGGEVLADSVLTDQINASAAVIATHALSVRPCALSSGGAG